MMPRVKRRRDSDSAVEARAHKKSAYARLNRRSRLYNLLALPETKVANFYSTTDTAVADIVYGHNPCTIAAGDAAEQREGMRIFPQWLRLRNLFSYTSGNAPNGGAVRRIVFIDWGFNGTGISILDAVGVTNGISNLLKSRIKIVRDDLFAVSNSDPVVDDTFIDLKPYYSQIGKNYVQYDGTNATDYRAGNITIWYIFSNAVAAGNFRYHHQLAFKP